MEWIPIEERLPEANELVVVINIERRYPVGGLAHLETQMAAYPYWSCYGIPSQSLNAFTHWCELPPIPWGDE